ncbi:hypothetical protein JQK87_28615 [Streptomyces sp. G44]|uniref:hypothetical protein n=1 Tax=Streptomyces sp. G44 TaxID=2807632 RepID=UPI0019611F11|nr:hypothetical protein [Streptomyces sp. G44]MBM7172284.1 hypothetical protein [Streptomyces sp. G44]
MAAESKPARPDAGAAPGAGAGAREPDPEGRRYFSVLFLVHLVLMLTLVGVAVAVLRIGDSATALTFAGGGFIAYVSAMTLYARRDERQEVTQHLLAFLAAFLVVALVGGGAWWFLATRPENVSGDARLSGGTIGADATARLVVDAEPGDNDRLRLTFTARDSVAGASPCLRLGKVRFVGADIEAMAPIALKETLTATLALDDPGPEVVVDLQLVGSADCRVELTLEKAEYRR